MRGGAQAQLMRASDQDYHVVKFRDNPQHTRVLANEFLASRLGQCLGLPIPDVQTIELSDWLIEHTPELRIETDGHLRPVSSGLHLASRFATNLETGCVFDYLPESMFLRVINRSDFPRILVLDKWTGNCDGRQAVFSQRAPRRGYEATFIDQGYCFNSGEWNFPDKPLCGVYYRNFVYASVDSWDSFEPALTSAEEMDISALYLLACIALAPATSFAESSVKPIRQYVHNVWRTEEGLPQNSVQAILQTRDGYLWLGTQEGLVRFNGAEFTVFNKANTDLIKHNDVRALLEDREGNLWIGTFGGGVALYRNGQFLRVYNRNEGLADNFVNALLQDKQGNIWIATNKGLNKFSNGRFTLISSDHGPSESINSLAEDQHGNIWLGTNRGLGQVFQGKATASIANLAGKVIRTVFIDRSGTLWIGTDQTGLFAMREGKIIHFGPGEQLPKAPILTMMQDMQGALWVGTGAG